MKYCMCMNTTITTSSKIQDRYRSRHVNMIEVSMVEVDMSLEVGGQPVPEKVLQVEK